MVMGLRGRAAHCFASQSVVVWAQPQSPGAPWECNWLMHRGLNFPQGTDSGSIFSFHPPFIIGRSDKRTSWAEGGRPEWGGGSDKEAAGSGLLSYHRQSPDVSAHF